MFLENKYYELVGIVREGEEARFRIRLLPECEVYRGHFPGNPVCPGVCNIEVVRECAMRLSGRKLFISHVKQCRLTAVATPAECSELDVVLRMQPGEGAFAVSAKMMDGGKTYLEYKGTMEVLEEA